MKNFLLCQRARHQQKVGVGNSAISSCTQSNVKKQPCQQRQNQQGFYLGEPHSCVPGAPVSLSASYPHHGRLLVWGYCWCSQQVSIAFIGCKGPLAASNYTCHCCSSPLLSAADRHHQWQWAAMNLAATKAASGCRREAVLNPWLLTMSIPPSVAPGAPSCPTPGDICSCSPWLDPQARCPQPQPPSSSHVLPVATAQQQWCHSKTVQSLQCFPCCHPLQVSAQGSCTSCPHPPPPVTLLHVIILSWSVGLM